MPRRKKCRVFVSYSRHDEELVKPLAGLLGAAANDAVFFDVSSLKPGVQWKEEIDEALRDASVFILCWCCEGQKSAFIAHEIKLALEDGSKRLVPVMLCPTPLPSALADRQWIDLQGRIVHACSDHGAEWRDGSIDHNMGTSESTPDYRLEERWMLRPGRVTLSLSPMSLRRKWWTMFIAGALIGIAVVAILFSHLAVSHEAPPSGSPLLFATLIVVAVVTAATVVSAAQAVFRLIRRILERSRADRLATTAISYFERIGKA
jgi:hypothetical protein